MSTTLTAPHRLRVMPNVIVQIKRRLVQGRSVMKVHPGYEVEPGTVLGEGQVVSGYKVVDIAKLLAVKAKDGQQYLKKQIGQNCFQGELLAEKEGFLNMGSKLVTASSDGVLDGYDDQKGLLRIKLNPKNETLLSKVYGVVDAVDIKKSEVLIRTQATVIFGMIGSGGEREGNLCLLSNNSSQLVSSRQIGTDLVGQIVVGGGMVFADALQKCVTLGVKGLITGGISASEFRAMSGGELHLDHKHWSDIGVTVLVTEGFGTAVIGEDIYQQLQAHEGKFCLVDGNNAKIILPTSDRNSMMYIRKTKNPILPVSSVVSQELKVGSRVRIIFDGQLGNQGIVSNIDQTATALPNGQAVIMVTVDTKKGKKQVALQNIEIY